jgi:hypothetical protein
MRGVEIMKFIPKKDFSDNREDLIFQIRWLVSEMSASLTEIELGNLDEAKNILKKEVEDNFFLKINAERK